MGILQHTQMFRHDPENGVYGDCWRATVASLLRLPIDAVPHVCDGPDDGKASERMRAFLESQNCALIQVQFNGDMSLKQILDYVGAVSVSGGLHWCLMGTSRTGCNHVVICKGAEIIHDPSIAQSGIVGPADDGLWWVEWVVQRSACDSPSPETLLPPAVTGQMEIDQDVTAADMGVNVECAECHGTGEVFGHADDCHDDLCALNGDIHSCNGQVQPCGCAAPKPHVQGRPDGHCGDDAAWKEFVERYGKMSREELGKGNMSDFALANAQFMCDRNSLDLIGYQTAVKDRIRWLSIQLAKALATASEDGR